MYCVACITHWTTDGGHTQTHTDRHTAGQTNELNTITLLCKIKYGYYQNRGYIIRDMVIYIIWKGSRFRVIQDTSRPFGDI